MTGVVFSDMEAVRVLATAVEVAGEKLAGVEQKAGRVKELGLRAERLRAEAEEVREKASAAVEAAEEELARARGLQGLVAAEVIEAAAAEVEQLKACAAAEVERLLGEAAEAAAEAAGVWADEEVQKLVAFREAEARAEAEAEARRLAEKRAGFVREVEMRRAAAERGECAEELDGLAVRAAGAGFGRVAAHAERLAGKARSVARAQEELAGALRKKRFKREMNRQAKVAKPGDIAYVLEEAGETDGKGLRLRPVGARRGQVRWRVMWAFGVEPPEEYSDLPRGRVWRWRRPPEGDVGDLDNDQAGLVSRILKGRLPSGYAINRANAQLREREQADEARGRAGQVNAGAESVAAEPEAAPLAEVVAESTLVEVEGAGDVGLEGLDARAARALGKVGVRTWQAVEEVLAAGEEGFLALPGVGMVTLEKVKQALTERVARGEQDVACEVEDVETETEPHVEAVEVGVTEEEMSAPEAAAGEAAAVAASEGDGESHEGARPASDRERKGAERPRAEVVVEAAKGEDGADLTPKDHLSEWKGAASRLGPVGGTVGIELLTLTVREEDGTAILVAEWIGDIEGKTTVTAGVDGRRSRYGAMREIIAAMKSAPGVQVEAQS
jgi:hypothetical protein